MRKKKIEPNIVLSLDIYNNYYVNMIIRQKEQILQFSSVAKSNINSYNIRKNIITKMKYLLEQYNFDTILMEDNQLFINKIDRYPDPLIMRDILFGYSLTTTIVDNFYETIPYILQLPEMEWRQYILNKQTKYAIDLYKDHILSQSNYHNYDLNLIEQYNFYKTLCISESIWFDKLIDKRYQINERN